MKLSFTTPCRFNRRTEEPLSTKVAKPIVDQLTLKLGISIALLVVCGFAIGFFLVYRHYKDHLQGETRRHMALEARLIRQALEYQMLKKDRSLIRRMVDGFASRAAVQRVMVLNREGKVAYSSDPTIQRSHFSQDSPSCKGCHQLPPARRSLSTSLEINGGLVLRSVQPIPNRPACHACHAPAHSINGMILVDMPQAGLRQLLADTLWRLAALATALALILVAGIAWVFRRLVLRRLFRFEDTARAIAEGDLSRRVPVEGSDALSRLEDQFNRMADAMVLLLDQVQEQRASLERVMNSVNDGMVVLDRERCVVAVNDAFRRRFPADHELLGLRCCRDEASGEAHCGLDRQSTGECPTTRCFTTGEAQLVVRQHSQEAGAVVQEEVISSPVFAKDGRISHVVEVWRDITDRRAAEARLADHQRMISLGMLASGFSHEVNTPLASVGTCLDAIDRLCGQADQLEHEAVDEVADYARIASTQVHRCGAITRQFLDLARGRTLEDDIVDVRAAAEGVARLCRRRAEDADVQIEVLPGDEVPSVLASSSAVQQVILNLVLNAIEASSAGGRICISIHGEEQVELRVEDVGKGVQTEDLERIFEPFYTSRDDGTGLGLFVSVNLARGWGGDIHVSSEHGKGTTFQVRFPRLERGTQEE